MKGLLKNKIFLISTFVIAISLLIAVTAFFLFKIENTPKVGISNNPGRSQEDKPSGNREKFCDGKLFDTHTHLDEDGLARDMATVMEENNVGCAIIFTDANPKDMEESFEILGEELEDTDSRFLPFFQVDPKDPSDINTQRLSTVVEKYGDYYVGLGEIAFYQPPWQDTSLSADPWPDVFKFVASNDLFLMIHLTGQQADDLDQMLSQYPKAKVLLHGFELKDRLVEFLQKHKNLYYTLDTANMISLSQPGGHMTPLMFPVAGGSEIPDDKIAATDLIEKYDQNKNIMLSAARENWLPIVEAAPNRVMWGTDIAFRWHTDPQVYKRLVEFSREFIEMLPKEHRDRYSYKNALNIFQPGSVALVPSPEDGLDLLD